MKNVITSVRPSLAARSIRSLSEACGGTYTVTSSFLRDIQGLRGLDGHLQRPRPPGHTPLSTVDRIPTQRLPDTWLFRGKNTDCQSGVSGSGLLVAPLLHFIVLYLEVLFPLPEAYVGLREVKGCMLLRLPLYLHPLVPKGCVGSIGHLGVEGALQQDQPGTSAVQPCTRFDSPLPFPGPLGLGSWLLLLMSLPPPPSQTVVV